VLGGGAVTHANAVGALHGAGSPRKHLERRDAAHGWRGCGSPGRHTVRLARDAITVDGVDLVPRTVLRIAGGKRRNILMRWSAFLRRCLELKAAKGGDGVQGRIFTVNGDEKYDAPCS
jgi:hypothetical protein